MFGSDSQCGSRILSVLFKISSCLGELSFLMEWEPWEKTLMSAVVCKGQSWTERGPWWVKDHSVSRSSHLGGLWAQLSGVNLRNLEQPSSFILSFLCRINRPPSLHSLQVLDFYNMWKLIVVTEVNPPQQIDTWQMYNVNTLIFIFHDWPGAGHVEVTWK